MSITRIRALVIVGVLVTCALVVVTVTVFKDRQQGDIKRQLCPPDATLVDSELREPKYVKINVINASGRAGAGTAVGNEFRFREFQVTVAAGDSSETSNSVAVLRFGPRTVGNAWLMRSYFLDEAKVEFDPKRDSDVVDIVIGTKFKQLATATEAKQALSQLGKPDLPEGTCSTQAP